MGFIVYFSLVFILDLKCNLKLTISFFQNYLFLFIFSLISVLVLRLRVIIVKRLVHPKMKISTCLTHPQGILGVL